MSLQSIFEYLENLKQTQQTAKVCTSRVLTVFTSPSPSPNPKGMSSSPSPQKVDSSLSNSGFLLSSA